MRRSGSNFTLKIDSDGTRAHPSELLKTNPINPANSQSRPSSNNGGSSAASNPPKKSIFSQFIDSGLPLNASRLRLNTSNKENSFGQFEPSPSSELWNLKQSSIISKHVIPVLKLNASGKDKPTFTNSSSLWIDKNAVSVTSIEPPEVDK